MTLDLLTTAPAPTQHHLVAQLIRLLDRGAADPELFDRLAARLAQADLPVAAAQARDAAALARVAALRPPTLPPEPNKQESLL